jgi:hypothetical protein
LRNIVEVSVPSFGKHWAELFAVDTKGRQHTRHLPPTNAHDVLPSGAFIWLCSNRIGRWEGNQLPTPPSTRAAEPELPTGIERSVFVAAAPPLETELLGVLTHRQPRLEHDDIESQLAEAMRDVDAGCARADDAHLGSLRFAALSILQVYDLHVLTVPCR